MGTKGDKDWSCSAATMKYLALALLLCALPSVMHAACFQQLLKPGATHCNDHTDGTWHAVGSNWRNSQCWDCACDGCCTAYSEPRSFPDDCVAELDLKECVYKVFKKDDPSVPCPIFASVGK